MYLCLVSRIQFLYLACKESMPLWLSRLHNMAIKNFYRCSIEKCLVPTWLLSVPISKNVFSTLYFAITLDKKSVID